nr:hypothetical protein [Tanacetum cinerariifolium]
VGSGLIQAIEKMLKTRRIMRSLEKFVGGRLLVVLGEEDDDDDKYGDERDDDDDDDDDDEEEIAKIDEQDDTERGGDDDEESKSDEESDDEETRKEESFDPIPRTPEDSEDDGNGKKDQGLRISEEERLNEEEEADELYRDVDINQGRGLPLSLDIEDSHVTLTPVNPDGQQESSSVSSQFMTSMLNPTSDADMESIFATASSPVAPLQTSTPIMTPSTIATISIISHAPIPPTPIPNKQTHLLKPSLTFQALVEAYEDDKIILDTYEETVTLKRRRDDESDKDEGPSAGSDWGSKRRIKGKEPESASAPLQTATRSTGRSTTGSKSRQVSASESAFAEEPVQTTCQMDEPSHPVFEIGQQYPHNLLQPLPLIPDNRGHRVISFAHFINNDLEYLRGGAYSFKYTTSVTNTKAAYYENIKWIEDLVPRSMWIHEPINYDKHAVWGVSRWGRKRQQFYGFAVNRESALDVYSKRRIIAVTDLKIVKWHRYKHLDWIMVRRDDDKLYKFKEGDFKRLHLQDIKDMLLLLVQGKLSNLTVEERFAFNVSLRMFTRSIVIQRRVEDLKLGVESYQKRLNITKPDTKNKLMRIDELHKFSDGTLNDVRNALDDRLKGIRMQYLPQTIWRKGNKDRAAAMIQAIDKMLKTRRIMRSLKRFIGGRLYEGDFRMLQWTI